MAAALKTGDELKTREDMRKSFRQEALAPWSAYRETGRHLTGVAVRAWLQSWGTDDEISVTELELTEAPRRVPG
jgi:predicted transcriptional regulator